MASRLALLAAAGVVATVTAWAGLWFVPFLIGIAAGLLAWRQRHAVLLMAAGVTAGWAVALWIMALRGYPVGATARVIAAIAGLPPYAFVTVTATMLVAFLQVLVGAWLARALTRAGVLARTDPERRQALR